MAVTLGAYLFAIGIVLICFSIMAHYMGRIFKDIKESYSPFCPEIIKNFKVVFVLITLLALYSSLLIPANNESRSCKHDFDSLLAGINLQFIESGY